MEVMVSNLLQQKQEIKAKLVQVHPGISIRETNQGEINKTIPERNADTSDTSGKDILFIIVAN
jgi:hypothetical protein